MKRMTNIFNILYLYLTSAPIGAWKLENYDRQTDQQQTDMIGHREVKLAIILVSTLTSSHTLSVIIELMRARIGVNMRPFNHHQCLGRERERGGG